MRARPSAPIAPASGVDARPWPITTIAVGAWAVLIAVAFAWGAWLVGRGHVFGLLTPPLFGRFEPRFGVLALPALALALAMIAGGPALARRVPWRALVILAPTLAGAWGAALASIDGVAGLRITNRLRSDFLATVPMVHRPSAFLARYTRDLASFSDHVHGHPPGLVLLLWALAQIGLGGPKWDTALRLCSFGIAIGAVLVTVREVAGEDVARDAAPFLFAAPFAAQGLAITADCVFAALIACAIALIVLSTGRTGVRSDVLAAAGGLFFGCALYFTYGALTLAVIPLVVARSRNRTRPLVITAAGVAVVAGVFAWFGFWWYSGLRMTWHVIASGARKRRVPLYFFIGNLAAFATTLGPAVVAGLARMRDRKTWLLVGGALAAVALANLSQLSRAEVERIWLPMAIWVAVAASALCAGRRWRWWYATHVGIALLVACLIHTTW